MCQTPIGRKGDVLTSSVVLWGIVGGDQGGGGWSKPLIDNLLWDGFPGNLGGLLVHLCCGVRIEWTHQKRGFLT